MSNSVQHHRRQPTRLLRPWDSPGKNTGVGCHFLLQCMKVKSQSEVAQSCQTLSDPMEPTRLLHPWDFSTQEYWSGVPLPSLILVKGKGHRISLVVQLLALYISIAGSAGSIPGWGNEILPAMQCS